YRKRHVWRHRARWPQRGARNSYARADGRWELVGGRLYRSTRRREADRGTWGDLHGRRRRADGGIRSADWQKPRGEEGADHGPGRREEAIGGNPERAAHGGRPTADRASERRDVGEHRPSGQPRQVGVRRGSAWKYVQRSRHALG